MNYMYPTRSSISYPYCEKGVRQDVPSGNTISTTSSKFKVLAADI